MEHSVFQIQQTIQIQDSDYFDHFFIDLKKNLKIHSLKQPTMAAGYLCNQSYPDQTEERGT